MSWKNNLLEFLKTGHEKELRKNLYREWTDFHPEDKEDIYLFMFMNGQDKLFAHFFVIDLQNQTQELPWILFLKLIHFHKPKVPKNYFNEIVLHLQKQKIIVTGEKSISSLIKALMEKQNHDFKDRIANYKKELLTSIQIAESERLEDQKVSYMNELKKLEPSRFNANQFVSEEEKNRAEKIMEKLKTKRRTIPPRTIKSQKTKDQKELIESIKTQALSYHHQGKAEAIDFAYLLRSIGESEMSVDFTYSEKEGSKRDWQILDYLFFGNQHISVLNHCELLKTKYAHDPDALFPVYYAEALAFWELGEKEKAMNLMSQISSMRPYFKSATKILSQWKEELFE